MIERSRLLSLGYYKKAPSFTGSDNKKCYKIERIHDEEADEDRFKATIWPGPYSSENTPEEDKQSNTASFTEEGLQTLVDWMNSLEI
mgnify:CR=1 FL=1